MTDTAQFNDPYVPPAPAAVAVPAVMTPAKAAAAIAINSALHRIRKGNAASAMEPLEQARAALAATPAQAVAVPADALESVRVLLRVAKNQSSKASMAHAIGVVQAEVEKAAARITAAPAQEHTTQLAGGAVSISHREWRFALQEAIDTMDAEIDMRDDEGNVRRMKRAKAVLSTMLAAAPAQAQEDARDALTLVELDQLDRAIEHFVEGEDTDVDWRLLTRAACLGFLECERFTVPPTARAAIDAARAAQGSAL